MSTVEEEAQSRGNGAVFASLPHHGHYTGNLIVSASSHGVKGTKGTVFIQKDEI